MLYADIPSKNKYYIDSCLQLNVELCVYKIIWLGWRLCFSGSVLENDHASVVSCCGCGVSLIEKAPGLLSKVFRASRRSSRRGWCQGESNAGPGHFLKLVLFLVLLEEYLLWSIDMHGKMIAVQLDDVNRAQMGVDLFSIIVCQNTSEIMWNDSTKGVMASFFFPTRLRYPASMTRDLSFNWNSAMTCECFSRRAWKD